MLEELGNQGIQAGKLVRWKKNIFFTCFDQVENIWDAHIENQTSFYKNHHSKLDVRERFLHATVANLPLLLWWGPPWDPRVDDSYKRMILKPRSGEIPTVQNFQRERFFTHAFWPWD